MTDVLLLHAGIADRRMWAPQIEALEAAGYTVTSPDLPGFGEQPLEPGEVDYAAFAAAAVGRPATVVGCSFGGRVALDLAVTRPELVARLVLVGAVPGGWDWSEAAQAGFAEEEEALERGDFEAAAKAQARMWLADAADDDVRALTETMIVRSYELQTPHEDDVSATWPDPPAMERLGEVAVPTLVVVGSEDVEDVHAVADRLVAGIPDARLERIEGSGHLPSLERPDKLSRLLLEFLQD